MGGPGGLGEIRDYLFRLFCDPHILSVPALLRRPLARLIVFLRTGKAFRRYEAIGGKSPLPAETEKQRAALEESLSLPVAVGMRYSRPFIPNGVSSLKLRGVDHLVLLSLYPQFSFATTQSALDHFDKFGDWKGPVHIIESHYDHPLFVTAHRRMLTKLLKKNSFLDKTAVVFIAHSIPLGLVRKGDPYVGQVESTVSLISKTIDPRVLTRTAYQSRLGPVKWQGPSLDDVLEELAEKGLAYIIAHPLSFTSENLETLYDLDIEFKQKCRNRGLELVRVPAPGTFPQYIEALSSTVKDGINQWELKHV